MAENQTETGCIACTSPAVARVQDGAFRKPVCAAHRRMYAQEGYLIDALPGVVLPPATSTPEEA